MLWPQFVVGIFLAPTHVGHHQAVVTDPRALDMEAAGATQAQLQHAIGADIEIFDADLHAIRRRRRRCAHFLAVENQADAKALATAAAVADQIQIAGNSGSEPAALIGPAGRRGSGAVRRRSHRWT
ncbi:hypothetical protein G6F51_014417 [Rhizopus arrhizus]|uniref:Uncharacterized protein n=1 Tax=Rhizopus oryzae TaxID=64495 RepID=A0A9P6XLY1_RHIOR|nr:hypothetical protein G6F51_014417 [Rhizopus arrhizus]